jgi:hypothetical protein
MSALAPFGALVLYIPQEANCHIVSAEVPLIALVGHIAITTAVTHTGHARRVPPLLVHAPPLVAMRAVLAIVLRSALLGVTTEADLYLRELG